MDSIMLQAPIEQLGERLIIRLSDDVSTQLPSRGQVASDITVDDTTFLAVIEPDGMRGHWLPINAAFLEASNLQPEQAVGQQVTLSINPTKDWPEPSVPTDLQEALDSASDIQDLWSTITPMARWEWVRWVKATKNPATRARRVDVSISKMRSGKRRPCCFDLSSCTDPELSKSGKLIPRS